jgi:hypothetical protein
MKRCGFKNNPPAVPPAGISAETCLKVDTLFAGGTFFKTSCLYPIYSMTHVLRQQCMTYPGVDNTFHMETNML